MYINVYCIHQPLAISIIITSGGSSSTFFSLSGLFFSFLSDVFRELSGDFGNVSFTGVNFLSTFKVLFEKISI